MSFTLGIDIGTSGVRTAVMDGDRLISMARSEHPKQDPHNIDANGWWFAVSDCLNSQLTALRELNFDLGDIVGIAVDGTSGSMVLTDAALNTVSPALMYNSKGFDIEAQKINATVRGYHITKGSNSALGRAMRLVSMATETPVHLLHQADFIAAKLMGQGGHTDYNNSLKTGFDPESESWPEWIGDVIDAGLLPQVHEPGSVIAPVSSQVAAQFGFSRDTKIHAGTTDSVAAFLACAPIEAGVAVSSLGSTLAIKLLSAVRIDDPTVGLYSHRLGNLWLVGGASNTGGAVLKQYFTDEDLVRLSAKITPEVPLGLEYYPLKEPGERFPINDPALPPKMEPRPTDDAKFLQAILEGMARIEAQCFEEIRARGGSAPSKIFTAGGGGKNDKWTEIRSRYLGVPLQISKLSEAACGTALLARN